MQFGNQTHHATIWKLPNMRLLLLSSKGSEHGHNKGIHPILSIVLVNRNNKHHLHQCFPSCNIFATSKERGRWKSQSKWGIETHDKRELYLASHWPVDAVDKLIKFASIFKFIWEHWNSPMRHGIVPCVVASMHCTKSELDNEWTLDQEDWLEYWQFWLKQSQLMPEYNPTRWLYKHGENMSRSTFQLK